MLKTFAAAVVTFLAATASAAGPDPVAMASKADVMKDGVQGSWLVAVHEVTDTAGKTEKQVYSVLNQISTGNSFIVISSENAEVNGTVYLIKGGTLYAAAPNQRSFVRLGSLNLDRRISGSLFAHWDLQGNIPLGVEYDCALGKAEAATTTLLCAGKAGSHYKKVEAVVENKTNLFNSLALYDDKGLLKTVTFKKATNTGGKKIKRKVPSIAEMKRAEGRSDLPVAKTVLHLSEVEFDPEVDYGEAMAASDANLQRLRSKYVVSGDRFHSLLAESED